jgi:hypothetical protein
MAKLEIAFYRPSNRLGDSSKRRSRTIIKMPIKLLTTIKKIENIYQHYKPSSFK